MCFSVCFYLFIVIIPTYVEFFRNYNYYTKPNQAFSLLNNVNWYETEIAVLISLNRSWTFFSEQILNYFRHAKHSKEKWKSPFLLLFNSVYQIRTVWKMMESEKHIISFRTITTFDKSFTVCLTKGISTHYWKCLLMLAVIEKLLWGRMKWTTVREDVNVCYSKEVIIERWNFTFNRSISKELLDNNKVHSPF